MNRTLSGMKWTPIPYVNNFWDEEYRHSLLSAHKRILHADSAGDVLALSLDFLRTSFRRSHLCVVSKGNVYIAKLSPADLVFSLHYVCRGARINEHHVIIHFPSAVHSSSLGMALFCCFGFFDIPVLFIPFTGRSRMITYTYLLIHWQFKSIGRIQGVQNFWSGSVSFLIACLQSTSCYCCQTKFNSFSFTEGTDHIQ